jgi:membrane protease YdiL (CAAX protease family)
MTISVPSHALAGAQSAPSQPLRWGPWATLAWSFGAAGVWVMSQVGGAVLFLLWWHRSHAPIPLDRIASNGPAIAFAVLFSTPFVVAFLWLATRLARRPFADYLALKLPRWRDLGIAAAGLIGLLLFASVLDAAAGKQMPSFVTDSVASARAAGMLPLLILGFVVLAPLQEELVFRGFLYRGISAGFGHVPTVLLTAGAWALLHAQYEWYFVAQIFVLGLYFGWLRWRSGSALLTFFMHALINATAIAQAAALAG